VSNQHNKNRLSIVLIISLLITISLSVSGGQAGSPSLSISWAVLYKTSGDTINTTDYEKNTIVLSQDDELKIFLTHESTTFLYLFLDDAEGDLYLFYPTFFRDFDSPGKPETTVYIPENLEWFSFEGRGIERFHLIASTERLYKLEESTTAYQKEFYSKKSNPERVKELKQRVMDEIQELRLEHFSLIKKARDDVLLVAGEFRGLEKTLEFPAQHVKADGFYARTIRIEH
jgi:hypothetical protein